MRIGILFGGNSREREVSFAGGRTVFDNLDKSLFTPVPIFIDSYLNLCLLDWQYIYKGSIRDFYDPDLFERANIDDPGQITDPYRPHSHPLKNIGKAILLEDLRNLIDFAFLTLHGNNGEDGRIQGVLEWLGIPYSGSGIISSGIGMDKAIQKRLMKSFGLPVPKSIVFSVQEWNLKSPIELYNHCKKEIGFPMVIKAAHQGSSIGVNIFRQGGLKEFTEQVEKTLFQEEISSKEWHSNQKLSILRHLLDFREGPGLPALIQQTIIYQKEDLIRILDEKLDPNFPERTITMASLDSENTILIESFIEGKEFSCIVLDNIDSPQMEVKPLALPPTEIRKPDEVYSYRSKYLPGLSRKITPIEEPYGMIDKICKACEDLYVRLGFSVYARIDGFLTKDGTIYLNDPNTTSGMMPSSFFFHQAAEIGLNPSQFLSYIIFASLKARIKETTQSYSYKILLEDLTLKLKSIRSTKQKKQKIGIILGGFSSERHISVESGRNIYEKFSASTEYEPIPLFLSGSPGSYQFYKIPVNILLKDNADDIREKIKDYLLHPVVESIIDRSRGIMDLFSGTENLAKPELWDFDRMKKGLDFVFIALHGRPGEDGEIQKALEDRKIPYNGSGVESSALTIDKFLTNELLAQNGILVPKHFLLTEKEWNINPDQAIEKIHQEFGYPFIAKPSDDGCSSAVMKIGSKQELIAYTSVLFRKEKELPLEAIETLHLNFKEEFPLKTVILIEELILRKDALNFMEITGGLYTEFDPAGGIQYFMMDPSEALVGKEILSLEEKFLAGEGQNMTPPRYSTDKRWQASISKQVKEILEKTARILGIVGYCRIDAFVRIFREDLVEVIIIEANSLPGLTPATAIFHQAALADLKPFDFLQKIVQFGQNRSYPE